MKISKIILGAKNLELNQIKKTIEIYSKLGVNIFDLSANKILINEVRFILKEMHLPLMPKICASITLENDIHSRKAKIIDSLCNKCSLCEKICSQKVINVSQISKINIDGCSGCGICANICPRKAIEMFYVNQIFEEQFYQAQEADYIEIHTNGQNKNLVDVFKYLKKQFNGDLGICISQNNNVKEKIEIIETVKNIIFPKKLIVQADGNPISGLNDSVATTQKAIEEAQNFQCIENIILILSGGTNAQTAKLANEKKLHFDGIAWGSFARKILDEKDSYKKAVNLLATLK